jgi:hypothetical protein
MMERQKEALVAANRLLDAFVGNKFGVGMKVPEKAKKVGLTVTNYHMALRRLRVLGRITSTAKPGELPQVLDAAPVTDREYIELGDPYSKKVPRRIVRKKSGAFWAGPGIGKVASVNAGILDNPLEFDVKGDDQKDVTVTISGPPDALAAFFRRVGRA